MVDAVRIDVITGPKDASEYSDEEIYSEFVEKMRDRPRFLERSALVFSKTMDDLIRFELWKRLGYESMDAYIEDVLERPRDWVDAALRITKSDAEKGIERKMGEVDAEAIQAARENPMPTKQDAGAKGGRGNKASNNVTSFEGQQRGNNQTYTLRRLSRERPDLLDQVEAGHLTANAAAIEAGFRTRKVQVEPTPESFQRAVQRHLPGWRLVPVDSGEVR